MQSWSSCPYLLTSSSCPRSSSCCSQGAAAPAVVAYAFDSASTAQWFGDVGSCSGCGVADLLPDPTSPNLTQPDVDHIIVVLIVQSMLPLSALECLGPGLGALHVSAHMIVLSCRLHALPSYHVLDTVACRPTCQSDRAPCFLKTGFLLNVCFLHKRTRRLQSSRTTKFVRCFLVFLATFVVRHGPTATQAAVDKVQPGIFLMLLQQVGAIS